MSIHDFLTLPCMLVAVTDGTPSTPVQPVYDEMGELVVTDDMGDTPKDERRTATLCDVQQSSAKEVRDGGLVDVTSWRLFLPPEHAITAADRVEMADGRTFAAEGSGWLVRDPFEGIDSHVEAVVRLVK